MASHVISAEVNQVRSTGCSDGPLAPSREYRANVIVDFNSFFYNTRNNPSSNCLKGNCRNNPCVYGENAQIYNSSGQTIENYESSFPFFDHDLDAWEDDEGGNCTIDSGDDCKNTIDQFNLGRTEIFGDRALPSNNFYTITPTYTIYNAFGRFVKSGDYQKGLPIKLDQLAPGVYHLQLRDDMEFLGTKKVIKIE